MALDGKKEDLLGHYTVNKLSPFRRITIDSLDVLTPVHNMLALLEVDITEAREKIRKGIREGKPLSLQAFIIKSIASAVEANKEMNSFLLKNRIYTFDDVDINIPLELNRQGEMFPGQVVIRRASEKSVEDIYREIEEAKHRFTRQAVTGTEDEWALRLMKLLFIFPAFFRKLILRKIINNPRLVKEKHGTIHFTSVAGFGQTPGFVVPCIGSFRAVDFTLGSIVKKPMKVGGDITLREVLTMTVMFNHDIVDGAPAARFTNRLRSIFEKAEEM
ncbi:MAG: 2-oxo acid dehydrogenase subunit E2 [Spirochaetales bacterium]|nr:2-oxo acid dehydrogenase subunit E2 [Spirochaetales bacterium]